MDFCNAVIVIESFQLRMELLGAGSVEVLIKFIILIKK
jgi:hypothetical protein